MIIHLFFFVHLVADCHDFSVSIVGASDTRDSGEEPVLYLFFDEVPIDLVRHHTCELDNDTTTWRHVR